MMVGALAGHDTVSSIATVAIRYLVFTARRYA